MSSSDRANKLVEMIVRAAGDAGTVAEKANGCPDVAAWRKAHLVRVGATGVAAGMVPAYHLLAVGLDMAGLVRVIGRASWGVGYISGRGVEDFVDPSADLFVILGLWSGEMTERHCQGIGMVASGLGFMVAGQSYPSFASAVIANSLGSAVGNVSSAVFGSTTGKLFAKNVKMGTLPAVRKFAWKITGKLATKGGGKLLAGFVPGLGGVVGGTINVYLLKRVLAVAETYYARKLEALSTGVTG